MHQQPTHFQTTPRAQAYRGLGALVVALGAALAPAASAGTPVTDAAVDAAIAKRVGELVGTALRLPPAQAAAARVAVKVGQIDSRLRLAPCQRIEPRVPPPGSYAPGRLRIALRCVEGERPWQVWLPVEVKVFAPALVSARALAVGSTLAAADLRVAEVDWAASGQQRPLTVAEELVGRTLARPLKPGQTLRSSDLRQRQWFAAGDTVKVLALGRGYVVSGSGQALTAGIEGQSVRVRLESGRVLVGQPVADRRVEVAL